MIKLDALNRLSYFADSEHEVLGQVSEYHMFINGRTAFKVFVQTEDAQAVGGEDHENCFPIWVVRSDNDSAAIKIDNAHAARKFDEKRGIQRISADLVKVAVLLQLPWILVELYVPEN